MKNKNKQVLKLQKQNSIFYFLFSRFCVFLLLSTFYFLFSNPVNATILYLEPSDGKYHQGDTFLVEVRIDVEDKCINVVDVNLSFSQDVFKIIDFSKGDSILTIWPEPPFIDQQKGLVSFVGGIPGGYCGRLPGDPEKTSLLGRIVFQVHKFTQMGTQTYTDLHKWEHKYAQIDFLEGTEVLLNDGFGTPAEFTTKGAIFTILPERLVEPPKDEWQEKLAEDNISPEPFEIKVGQNPAIFGGKYFIVFSTTDKQTGVDYFEIKEGKRDWQRAESPFLLEDQALQSIIKVKAVDMAGNKRIAEYLPLEIEKPFPYWVILIIIGLIIIGWGVKKFLISKS